MIRQRINRMLSVRHLRVLITTLFTLLTPGLAGAQSMCGFELEPDSDTSDDVNLSGFATEGEQGSVGNENISLSADSASFDTANETILVEGNVELKNTDARIIGESATYKVQEGEFTFKNSEFTFNSISARGNAGEAFVSQKGVAKFKDVKYTTCPEDAETWSLTAKEIKLDINSGMASTKRAALRFKNIPVLYLPYATYPISDKRKSGFLIPEIKTSNQRGFELATPWYWNIAPNYDATFTPRYMSKRGLSLGAEGRFLTKRWEGSVAGDYLANDDITDTDRYIWNLDTKTFLTKDWRVSLDATGVSDDRYLNDFSTRWSVASKVALNRSVALEHYGKVWSILARFQDYQTIDELITEDEEPYVRLPQISAIGDWNKAFLGADYRLETEGTYFIRDNESTKGFRLHVEPEISYDLTYKGLYLTPKIGVFHTSYNLENTQPGENNTPSVTAGVYSVDSGATFQRLFNSGAIVTLEPRAQYVYVPYENQAELPVFDTILPDTNLIQLFRPNRYLRYDRIGDTNQLNLGFTSRVYGGEAGRELITVALGHARYYTEQQVVLPDEEPRTENSGDYLLQARVSLWDSWNLDAGYQWNSSTSQTDQGNIRVQVKPWKRSVFNVDYRYQRQSALDQGAFSFALPMGSRWNLLGRAVYSVEDNLFVDQFAGLEYETCCWGIRLIGRQRVSRDIDETDTSIGIQLVLKGFTEIGNSVRGQLESGILGYNDL